MRRFYLYKRQKYYYVQLINPETKKPLPARSTGQTSKDEAAAVALDWIKNGIPDKKKKRARCKEEVYSLDSLIYRVKNTPLLPDDVSRIVSILKDRKLLSPASLRQYDKQPLINYLLNFWDYDTSPYIREKLSHDHRFSRDHAHNRKLIIEKYWKPYFKNTVLQELTREQLKEFSSHLSEIKQKDSEGKSTGKPLSAGTKNHILRAGTAALAYAAEEKIISENPAEKLKQFTAKPKKRGILSDKEVRKLFSSAVWVGNPGNRLGNLLAMQTGLRLGEVIALQIRDIGVDRLFIRHSWSESSGLKGTKTNEERTVPLLPETRKLLLEHVKTSPWRYGPKSFIFWDINSDKRPHAGKNISRAFMLAVENIGIESTERKARGLCFHSWRHYYTRKMTDLLDQKTAKLTGHKTPSMLEHYANHANEEDFKKASKATTEAFGRILQFKKEDAV